MKQETKRNKDKDLKIRVSDEDLSRLSFCQEELNMSKSRVVRLALEELEKKLILDEEKNLDNPAIPSIYLETITREDIGFTKTVGWSKEELILIASKHMGIEPGNETQSGILNGFFDSLNLGRAVEFAQGGFKTKYRKLTRKELKDIRKLLVDLKKDLDLENCKWIIQTMYNERNTMEKELYVNKTVYTDTTSYTAYSKELLAEVFYNHFAEEDEKLGYEKAYEIIDRIDRGEEYAIKEKSSLGSEFQSIYKLATPEELRLAAEEEQALNEELDSISLLDQLKELQKLGVMDDNFKIES